MARHLSARLRAMLAGALAAAFLGAALAPPASGAAATSSIAVSATVLSSCSVTAGPLAFGNYLPTASRDATSSIVVTCTTGTPYTVALDAGLGGPSATVAARRMVGPSQTEALTYQLHSDAARTSLWGHTPGTDTVAGAGVGGVQTITVYGRIPAGQNVSPGAYTDTVLVTISY